MTESFQTKPQKFALPASDLTCSAAALLDLEDVVLKVAVAVRGAAEVHLGAGLAPPKHTRLLRHLEKHMGQFRGCKYLVRFTVVVKKTPSLATFQGRNWSNRP